MRRLELVVWGYLVDDGKVLLIHHRKLKLWLPVGGHIEEDETPNDALRREFKEEVGLEVDVGLPSTIPESGKAKTLACPFAVNVHSVGDHDHCCFFYVCKALHNRQKVDINHEIIEARWFSQQELEQEIIPPDVKIQAEEALKIARSHRLR